MKRMAFGVVAILVLSLMVSGAAMAQGKTNVTGKWESKFTTPQGEMTTTFTFKQEGEKLTGTVAGGRGGETPLEGTVKGNEVKFTVTRQTPNGEMKTEYTATVEGDTMKGSVVTPRGTRDWSATKAK
ncbi:MAG: hypothetical protein M1453_00155 [Acidobacteria bacterium]|nr:hypothetical protein [Acidobacteriota bacterium]MCL5286400.1 hypothetical protein [Acidobacteriota bacterium]